MLERDLEAIAELLREAVDMRPGRHVLDVATGNGNTALATARRFGEVTGIDYVSVLLEEGRKRAATEGLQITFQEGDGKTLPERVLRFRALHDRCHVRPTRRRCPASCYAFADREAR